MDDILSRLCQTDCRIIELADEYLLGMYTLDDEKMQKLDRIIENQMNIGLASEQAIGSLKMSLTPFRDIPDGTESGEYLTVEFSNYKIRITHIVLEGQYQLTANQTRIYRIPNQVVSDPSKMLINHIATCIKSYIDKQWTNHGGKKINIAFNVAYPIESSRKDIITPKILYFTKRFICPDLQNKDLGQLVKAALKTMGISNVNIVAMVNDTVCSLLSTAFSDKNCKIGAVIGSGFNISYMEKLNRIGKWNLKKDSLPRQVIVSTEMGALGSNGCLSFLQNAIDQAVDEQSTCVGRQIFEKMIGGFYLGEQVRIALIQLAERKLIFDGLILPKLRQRDGFRMSYISTVHMDDIGAYELTREVILENLGYPEVSNTDCEVLKHVCTAIVERSAHLAAEAVAVCVQRMNLQQITVAIDGSLYRMHPTYRMIVATKLQTFLANTHRVHVTVTREGGGFGAALAASLQKRFN